MWHARPVRYAHRKFQLGDKKHEDAGMIVFFFFFYFTKTTRESSALGRRVNSFCFLISKAYTCCSIVSQWQQRHYISWNLTRTTAIISSLVTQLYSPTSNFPRDDKTYLIHIWATLMPVFLLWAVWLLAVCSVHLSCLYLLVLEKSHYWVLELKL